MNVRLYTHKTIMKSPERRVFLSRVCLSWLDASCFWKKIVCVNREKERERDLFHSPKCVYYWFIIMSKQFEIDHLVNLFRSSEFHPISRISWIIVALKEGHIIGRNNQLSPFKYRFHQGDISTAVHVRCWKLNTFETLVSYVWCFWYILVSLSWWISPFQTYTRWQRFKRKEARWVSRGCPGIRGTKKTYLNTNCRPSY